MITVTAPESAAAGSSICITVTGASGDIAVSITGVGVLSTVVMENGVHKITIKTSRGDWGAAFINLGVNGARHAISVVVG